MFAKRVEGRHSREFIHTLGVVGKQHFLIDFDEFSFRWVPLEPPGRPWVTRWYPRVNFRRFSGVPGMPCGVLVVSLGDLGPALERPWASRGRQEQRKKNEEKASGAHCVSESTLSTKK